MNLAVSKHGDLLIRECSLYSVWVVPEIVICGQVIFWGSLVLVAAGEVLGLECLEVFLEDKS